MPKIQFFGRILPNFIKFEMGMPDLIWKWSEENIDINVRLKIGSGFVNVECEVPHYKPDYLSEIYKRAYILSHACVDLIGFSIGVGFSAIFEAFVDPDGMPHELVPADSALQSICTAYNAVPGAPNYDDFLVVLRLVIAEPALSRAMADLTESIIAPDTAAINCGRVIDSICRMLTLDAETNLPKAWESMRKSLNITREYQQFISDVAKGPRHADPTYIPAPTIQEVKLRTWNIMNRFLEYRKRGNVALPTTDFPILG